MHEPFGKVEFCEIHVHLHLHLEWHLVITRQVGERQSWLQAERHEPVGYPEWSGLHYQGQEQVAEGADARTDGGGSQETGKKKNRAAYWTTGRRCSIRRDDLWTFLNKKSSMEKNSLRKTNQCQTEANDKVLVLESGHREGLGYVANSLWVV